MKIENNLVCFKKNSIPDNVDIVAVSKTKPINDLKKLIMLDREFLVKIKFKKW